MCRRCKQYGLSLMELLVALATILILISALIGVGSGIKTRAQVDQTKAMLETLSTALEQYYSDFGSFPFVTEKDFDGDGNVDPYDKLHLEYDVSFYAGVPALLNVTDLLEKDGNNSDVSGASSAALFYFLDKNSSSRAIVETVANTLVTNKDATGVNIQIDINGTVYDLPRYIDPWGTSVRYEYLDGTAFPVLTSAGPDKIFDTPDDITSK